MKANNYTLTTIPDDHSENSDHDLHINNEDVDRRGS